VRTKGAVDLLLSEGAGAGRLPKLSHMRPTAADLVRAVLVTAICIGVTLLLRDEPSDGGGEFDAVAAALIVLACAPIAVWRAAPLVPAICALSSLLAGAALGYSFTGPVILALGLVGLTASRAEGRVTGSLGVFSGVTLAVVTFTRADSEPLLTAIGGFAIGMLPALIGERLRVERARALDAQELARRVEELRDRDVQRAVAEERLRIARDVHDITGHHLSAISLQAAGASRTTADPLARAVFERIHGLTTEALGQTRRALGALRAASDPLALAPPPHLAHIEHLLEPARTAGSDVELRYEGRARELSETIELSAYRVIQESLTNVVRHAGARTVRIVIGYADHALTVAIDDDGAGRGPVRAGRGIQGMRERVALVGGELAAGPRDGGGWSVRATLPLVAPR
jgi:signal transduction histidine kinase